MIMLRYSWFCKRISETYVIIRQYPNDGWRDESGPYDDHTGESKKDAGVIRTQVDKVRQSRGGNGTVDCGTSHHEDDREQRMTPAESESHDEDSLYTGANEGG